MVNAETDPKAKIFNRINPVNTLAKFSAPGVWQNPEVFWETFNDIIKYTK